MGEFAEEQGAAFGCVHQVWCAWGQPQFVLLIMTFGVGGEKCEFADGDFGQEVRVLQWCQKKPMARLSD